MAETTRDRIVKQAIECIVQKPHAPLEEIAILFFTIPLAEESGLDIFRVSQ